MPVSALRDSDPSAPAVNLRSVARPAGHPEHVGGLVAAPSAVNRGGLDPQPVHAQPAAGLADQDHDEVTAHGCGHRGGQLRVLAGRHHRDRREAVRPVGAARGAARNGAADGPGQPAREQRAASRDRGEHRRAARIAHGHDRDRAFFAGLAARPEGGADLRVVRPVSVPESFERGPARGREHEHADCQRDEKNKHGRNHGNIGSVMTVPINSEVAPIGPQALADLLGRWPAADGPLYRLLATRIGRLADTGELPPGIRLPPERALAAALAVSRNTVALAYQVLRDDGMAESRQGSGTRLMPHLITPAAAHRANGYFSGMLGGTVAIDLTAGRSSARPLVAEALQSPRDVLGAGELSRLTPGAGYLPYGLAELRAAIAAMLATTHSVPASAAEVLVTTGAQQALDLLVHSEVTPGQAVVTEDPTFPGFLDVVQRAGGRLVGVPPGDVAAIADAIAVHRPALVYLIPSFHNPTGSLLPAAARGDIVGLARRHPTSPSSTTSRSRSCRSATGRPAGNGSRRRWRRSRRGCRMW